MHCGLHITKTDTQKVSEERKDSLSRKFQQELGFSTSLEDRGVFSIARCPILTFLTLESDGHWRIFAVPLKFPDHTNHMGSGVQVNMDSLHMVSPPSISSYRNQQNVWKGPPAVESYTARNFPGSNVQRQSQNKALTNKATKLNELSNNSSHQNSFICSNSPGLNRNGSKANSSSDLLIDSSQLDKAVKRNSRKKARKKKKQSMKLLSDSGSTELEVLSEEYAHGSPTSETL
ncbi:uncharacterized protein LOC112002249 [Quercus suber]|uniref:uncharacterized protein LOC112002249 n=1 Tax=Quercus suber TaxID=58331 RepID=UPI0032DF5355